MFTPVRRGAMTALACLFFALPLPAQQKPWDAPAFAADPKALAEAAGRVEAGDFAMVMLLDEAEYVIDESGATRSRERAMLYVVSEAGVEWASEVRAPWQPWHSERPTIEARVVTRDGTVHRMDQSAVVEVPGSEEADIFSDTRVLRAPLPAVAAGSVVEYVITRSSRHPIPGAGTAVHYDFGGYLPIERTRVTLDAPLSLAPRVVNRTGVEPRVEEKDGRRRTIYEAARIEGTREVDEYVPYDVAVQPYLAFSTGSSWQEIAAAYAAIVDKQIAGADLEKMVRAAVGTATDRSEIVTRLLAAMQKDIRYAGVEIGEGSIVPRTPRQVLANKYGDCKDKAAMLVSMLRIAGFPAHVALLRAGTGFDVQPELPALGHFNHAIVVVEGEPAIWVDPTDVFARAGELPLADQGRLALIARPETTTLTRTPELPSSADVYRELRTFVLPEEGKARVVEVTEPSGASESNLRRWVSGLEAKKLRDQLEEYAKSAYVAKSLTRYESSAPTDLTQPFRLTIEVPESGSGVVADGEGEVVINLAALPQHIPAPLRDWEEMQPGQAAEDAPRKRTHDFLFPQPGIREWVYRIVPPAGYVPRTLPPPETKKVGTTTFTQEIRAEADRTVVATFRFDSGKRRITPPEFEETRVAFTKFVEDNAVTIGFEQVGQAKLNAGDVRGALDEFRALAALHPKEAQHHIEIARALLAGGLGDAAREEIRRAIAIEPKHARAHHVMGTILLHDSLGRQYRSGFDLKGAIAALRKAKALAPDDFAIRVGLATALSYGEDGYRFGRGAQLAAAAEEIQALARDLGDEGKPMLPELTLLYAHMGRFADMRAVAPTYDSAEQRDIARIIATAALDGTEAAIRELGAFDVQRKRSYAAGAAQVLMAVRLYAQAAALMDVSTQGTAAAADERQRIDLIRRLKRVEDLPVEEGPRRVVSTLYGALLRREMERMKEITPADLPADGENPMSELETIDLRAPEGVPLAVFEDVLAAMVQVQQDGDDETGYRLRIRAANADVSDEMSLFVRRENGRWVIRGAKTAESLTGHTVLAMVARGELDAARRWLNWAREEARGGSGDDPLDGVPLATLWSKARTAATADEIRVAAASLATDKFTSAGSEPILLAAREKVESGEMKAAIDLALASIYENRAEWPKALAVTSRLVASHPDSATAFTRHVQALLRNGRAAEASALARQRLERLPGDREATHALALSAAESGDYDAAQQYATKLVDELRPKQEDFHHAAWMALFTGKHLERAVEHAQQAAQQKTAQTRDRRARTVPALAALYAETGRTTEARTALLQGIDAAHRRTLHDGEWYVLGRIAENYGVDDFAITAYRKVSRQTGAATVAELAQRRLDALVKKKQK